MGKLLSIIKDRKGSMTLWSAVIVLVLCFVFAGVFEYVRVYTVANTVQTTVQRDLESTAMQAARDSYESVKQYSLSSPYVNQTDFEDNLCSELGLAKQGNLFYCMSDDVAKFYILNPTLTYSVDTSLNLTYTFTLQIPTYFMGRQITTTVIPMTVHSEYRIK
jgi:Flp pilus assembly protein TadG